jgi:hypothetical protein
MRNYKNRKRMASIAIAFLLTFVMGAAFAFAPGMLEIGGQIGIAPGELCVIWTDGGTTSQSTTTVASTNISRRTSGVGGANHRLEWAIGFVDGQTGTVTLTATATNNGSVPAILETPTIAWGPFGNEGLNHTLNATAFVGPLAVGATSGNLVLTVEMPTGWVNPLGFGAEIDPLHSAIDGWFDDQLPDDVYEILTSFLVTLVYEADLP